ncbi:MAG: regulatory iron-sulfur-containing complex subunit RicT, partial [Planctomycetota bacterium]
MANGNDRPGDDREKMSSPSPETDSLSNDGPTQAEGELSPPEPEAPSEEPLREETDENARMSGQIDEAFSQGELIPGLTTTASLEDGPSVIVRYGQMRHIGVCRHNLKTPPRPGQKVVVRTDRGVELGEVVSCVCGGGACGFGVISSGELDTFVKGNGAEYPFHRDGKIMRLANTQDIIDDRHLRNSGIEERAFCRQLVKQMNLPMRIVSVDHLLGGERIIFYFTSEARVDFRDMVHELAAQYHTRIEIRQVGARDEARLVADYEKCGQQCCCQSYLKDLRPVSMRMAKTQKASLDPTKISGRCGRLMCCLRYEDAGYEELKKRLPRKNSWVRTEKQYGRVVDAQILTQLVMIELLDRTQVAVANEEIVERNSTPPSPEQLTAYAPREREDRGPRVRLADQAAKQSAEKAQAARDAAPPEPSRPASQAAEPTGLGEGRPPVPSAEEIPLADVAYYENIIDGGPGQAGGDDADEETPARDEPIEVGGERRPDDSTPRRRRRRKGRSGSGGGGGGG